MAKIKLSTNAGSDDCIYEVEDSLIDENIDAELETVKHEYCRH